MNAAVRPTSADPIAPAAEADDASSLPAWIYHDPEFFELEKQLVFRKSWQLLCHVNDIPWHVAPSRGWSMSAPATRASS